MPPKKTAVKAQPAAAKPAAKSQKTVKKVADEDEEDDDDMDDDEEEEADAGELDRSFRAAFAVPRLRLGLLSPLGL